jgi:hypothetical protein
LGDDLLLSQTELDITKAVVHRFLNLGESTPRKGLLVKAQSRELLEKLGRWSVLKLHDNKYYLPLAFAFHCCGDTEASLARQSVAVVSHVLRNLFENDQGEDTQYTPADVEGHSRKMYDVLDPKHIRLGLYLAQEFNFFSSWSAGQKQTEINFLKISEHIMEINPENIWDDYIKHQTHWIETQAASGEGVLRSVGGRRQFDASYATCC